VPKPNTQHGKRQPPFGPQPVSPGAQGFDDSKRDHFQGVDVRIAVAFANSQLSVPTR
jgi:hypothetical protein